MTKEEQELEILKEYKELYSIVGISPNDIEDIKEDKDIDTNILKIEKLIKADDNGKIVAVGEIGLDYYWNKENKELQKIIFKKQIELANKYNLPIVIHTRDARKITGHSIPAEVYPRRAGDSSELIASSERAKEILGWTPKITSLETIVETAWNWHKNHPNGYNDK